MENYIAALLFGLQLPCSPAHVQNKVHIAVETRRFAPNIKAFNDKDKKYFLAQVIK